MKELTMKTFLNVVVLSALCVFANRANADDLDLNFSLDGVSEYVFRGATFAGTAIQPGLEASYGKFFLGGWASLPIGEEADTFADEVNIYAGYGWALSESFDLTLGATLYHFPQSGGLFDFGIDAGDASTLEFFSELSFNAILSPALIGYYDIDLKSLTGIGRLSHDYPLTASAYFTLEAEAGFVSSDLGTDYEWGQLSGSMNWGFTDRVSAYGKVSVASNTKKLFIDTQFDPDDATTIGPARAQNTWFGVGLRVGF